MSANQKSVVASLEAKLTAFVSTVTDEEPALLATVLERGGDEVTGFGIVHTELQSDSQSLPNVYAMLSNIMKTKHDTVKNSIGNIR